MAVVIIIPTAMMMIIIIIIMAKTKCFLLNFTVVVLSLSFVTISGLSL